MNIVTNLQLSEQEFQLELGIFVFTTIRRNDIRIDPRTLLVPTRFHNASYKIPCRIFALSISQNTHALKLAL